MTITKASETDAGCWIEGSRGQYAISAWVQRAADHGMPLTDTEQAVLAAYDAGETELVSTIYGTVGTMDWVSDLSDVAERWMTEHVAPEGYSFGWFDGEVFLWSETDWAEVGL